MPGGGDGKPFRWIVAICLCAFGATVGWIRAFSGIPIPGRSGGPIGYQFDTGNCTACHEFNAGGGGVELLGLPRRYRPGAVYDFQVRVFDIEQKAAGFQVSVEDGVSHIGEFTIVDPVHTQGADFAPPYHYVMHTSTGVSDAEANWAANGGSVTYAVRWNAPSANEGTVTVYAAGNAVNRGTASAGDRYYATWATLPPAVPGDGDGDTDADLADFAGLQRCFGDGVPWNDPSCQEVDFDGDGAVTLSDLAAYTNAQTGPTTTVPGAYLLADPVRGGLLYDRWWAVNGATPPTGDHPLYPAAGLQSGSATFRCKECHGWDYAGVDGAYGSGPHFTGIGGVLDTTLGPQELFDLLKSDDYAHGGHNLDAFGMSDRDLWDVVRMTLEKTVDTTTVIDANGTFLGDASIWGPDRYIRVCASCHGTDGQAINFGTDADPEYIGTLADANPWEFLHKMRFGHPGTPMPSLELLRWDLQAAADIGAYAQTLPP